MAKLSQVNQQHHCHNWDNKEIALILSFSVLLMTCGGNLQTTSAEIIPYDDHFARKIKPTGGKELDLGVILIKAKDVFYKRLFITISHISFTSKNVNGKVKKSLI